MSFLRTNYRLRGGKLNLQRPGATYALAAGDVYYSGGRIYVVLTSPVASATFAVALSAEIAGFSVADV